MRTLIGAAVAALLLAGAPLAPAHQGNPNMRSEVTAVTPATDGVTVDGPQPRRPARAAQHQRQAAS